MFTDKDGFPSIPKIVSAGVFFIATIILAFTSWFITPEGHVDVVKRFSKASYIATPGLNFKIPVIDTTTTIEVRTRKNSEEMAAATSEQMPVKVTASMNWTVKRDDVLQLFKDYGSLDQFEARVIDPRFRSIVKESVAKFKAEETIGKRDIVTTKVIDALSKSVADLPISISAINIEDIALPTNYLKSIETKQTEKNLADAEVFKLEKQKLEALRAVNTADAEKQAAMQVADGKAYAIQKEAEANAEAIKLKGLAEAEKIDAITKAMKANPQYVDLVKAQQWDGALPKMMPGNSTGLLLDLRGE